MEKMHTKMTRNSNENVVTNVHTKENFKEETKLIPNLLE